MRKLAAILAMALVASIAQADFAPNPKGAVKALKVESGKPFRSGMVFIDGKYIPPPYTVQRYGLVLRINKIPVTGPLIPWERFVKTQEGVKATKTVPAERRLLPRRLSICRKSRKKMMTICTAMTTFCCQTSSMTSRP